MNSGKQLLFILTATLFLISCSKKDTPMPDDNGGQSPQRPEFVVAGYIPYYRNVADIPDRIFRMCNVINYAFANVTSGGSILVREDAKLKQIVQKARANKTKVLLSVGEASNMFAEMSNSEGKRNIFVADVMQKIKQYGLDGVDIDWEYPKSSDGSKENYRLLMKQLSEVLHKEGKYFLTAAITPGIYAGSIRDGISDEVFKYADWFNVMVYDDFFTDPSVKYRQHSPYSMAVASVDYWVVKRGMPKSKFILGIPVYGRPSGMTQSGTVLTYNGILQQGGSAQSDSAKVTAAGFSNYTIYYNGIPTVQKKTRFAQSSCGGIMFWEIGQDASDDRSLVKAAADELGINY